MRVVGVVFLIAAFGAAQAHASSFVTLDPVDGDVPSITTLGDDAEIDPSIVAAISETGPSPSIIALADTPMTPSIITLGEPAGPAGEEESVGQPSQRVTIPMVIRGGEVGEAAARPSPAPASAATQPGVPLLDPNDRGTPAKRKALKRQAARLAEEAAAAKQNPQPDPSTQPVPFGQ
jgi:hypothetical protein